MFEFSFLNSFFLWGLAAASIPVIIHLIKRNRAVKVHFAAMRFLKTDPNERFKSQRLKQLILLLLRIAAMLILALAFARPFWQNSNTAAFWGETPSAVVILVDNSFSMGRGENFNKAVEETRDILKKLKRQDRVSVVQFAEISEVIGEADNNARILADQIADRFKLSAQSTNYMQALQTAESILLEFPNSGKKIYLISDFQKSGWVNLNPHWRLEDGVNLNFVSIGNNQVANLAVQDVLISANKQQKKDGDILVRIRNYSENNKKSNIKLFINNKQIAQRNLTFSSNEEQTVKFRNVNLRNEYVYGYIEAEVSNDDLAVDNRFYFVYENRPTTQILAVNGEPNLSDKTKDELFFLENAINLPKVAKYSLEKTFAHDLHKHDFKNYRIVILSNVKDIKRETADRLQYYVRSGGGLIIALGDKINVNIFNSLFKDLSPATLNNAAYKNPDRGGGVILAEIDYQHPIFKIFADAGQSDPSVAQFYQYIHATPFKPEAVLASFDDGSPALLERKVGDGKVLLFTSSFDSEWNNMPVKAIYLPLLYQTFLYAAAEEKGQKSYLVGNPVSLQGFGMRAGDSEPVEVILPSGNSVETEDTIFRNTNEPGIYRMVEGKREAFFAVNVDNNESDIAPLPPNDLQAKAAELANPEIQTASVSSGDLNDNIEKRQKLWRFAILLLLLFMVLETWLANRTYR